VDQAGVAQVSTSAGVVDGDGTEEDDGEWKFIGDRLTPDPAADHRPMGAKSKFWETMDDDSDDEVAIQLPYTPDLVRHAAVHGFTKDCLCEAKLALRDSSIWRRVEAPSSPVTTNSKVQFVHNIMRALTDVRRPAVSPWLGKLPRPRELPALTLGDCLVKVRGGRKTLAEALQPLPETMTNELVKHGGDQRTKFQTRCELKLVTALNS
jgi:hypothetical protein